MPQSAICPPQAPEQLSPSHLRAIRRALWTRRILLIRESSAVRPRHLPATRRELRREIQEIQETLTVCSEHKFG